MPIRIVDSPEPLTYAAKNGIPLILAESDASIRLRRLLDLYLQRKVHGRSVLISGHRGSGKTTMVRQAIQEVAQKNQRPLLVPLHGPDLMPPAEVRSREAQPDLKISKDGEAVLVSKDLTEDSHRVLQRIVVVLYRSLAREMVRCFRQRVKERDDAIAARSNGAARQLNRESSGELAAHFDLLLDTAPSLVNLRELWQRLGLLESGVLFSSPRPFGQGSKELIALASAAQAYRRISGQEKIQRQERSAEEQESVEERSTTFASPDLSRALIGIFAGAAVGAGFIHQEPLIGVLAALTAIVVTSVQRWKLTSRRHAAEEEVLYIPDTSLATLERELPVLIERLHESGLSPVFAIDELDKVERLDDRMPEVIHHLKHLVTEGAFFCFLTDRDYYEGLRVRSRKNPYPREHTYFTDRLFLCYKPGQLRAYLNEILEISGSTEDRLGGRLLPYALLHRTQMHPVDLRRELSRLDRGDGFLNLMVGDVRSRYGYRTAITLQLAIEQVVFDRDVRERLAQDSEFAQLLFDVLYYPFRQWQAGNAKLEVNKATLEKYLNARMFQDAGSGAVSAGTFLTTFEIEFCLIVLKKLADLLVEPERLREEVIVRRHEMGEDYGVLRTAYSLVPRDRAFLSLVCEERSIYRWCYDPFGRKLPDVDRETGGREKAGSVGEEAALSENQLDFERLLQAGRQLQEFDDFLFELTERIDLEQLASSLFLLPSAPSWLAVKKIIEALENLPEEEIPGAEIEEDLRILGEYLNMIRQRRPTLEKVLSWSVLAGRAYAGGSMQVQAVTGLNALARVVEFASQETDRKLDKALEDLDRSAPDGMPLFHFGEIESVDILSQEWRDSFREWREGLEVSLDVDSLRDEAWGIWEKRFKRFFVSGDKVFPPGWPDLATTTANVPPGNLLWSPLDAIGLFRWSELLRLAYLGEAGVPSWVAVPALAELALGSRVSECLERWFGNRSKAGGGGA